MYSETNNALMDNVEPYLNDIRDLKNEIVMSNLFMASSNPNVFELLDSDTKRQLSEILATYTEKNVELILSSNNKDAKTIKKAMLFR